MSAIAIITQKLLASPEIVALVGNKIFPIQAPQQTERPFIVLHLIDSMDEPLLAGAGKYYRSVAQCDVYAEMTPSGAMQVINIGDAVMDVLNGVVKEKVAGCVDVDVLLGGVDSTDDGAFEAETHRRYTQYTVRFRRQPGAPADDDDEQPSGVYTFSLTAAAGVGAIGFAAAQNFQSLAPFGSIDEEPIAAYTLQATYRTAAPSNNSIVAFTGDVSNLLSGKSVWVNGVDYGPGAQYQFTYVNGVTVWNRITGGPVFAAGQTYNIEIK